MEARRQFASELGSAHQSEEMAVDQNKPAQPAKGGKWVSEGEDFSALNGLLAQLRAASPSAAKPTTPPAAPPKSNESK